MRAKSQRAGYHALVFRCTSQRMTDTTQPKAQAAELKALAKNLATAQHDLIDAAARAGGLPALGTLRRISELETAIAAVIFLIEERSGSGAR
jgi:hypothetical protein